MDVSSIKPVSDKVYLADAYPPFKVYESENREDWAWITVRRATEADNMRRAKYLETSTIRYLSHDQSNVIAESIQGGDSRERIISEVYWTLEDAGNLNRDGVPLFPKLPVRDMTIDEFVNLWHSLLADVSAALYAASLTVNTIWMD